MKRLLWLYPKAWRDLYGEEVATMLDDSGSGLRDVPDLVRGAVDAHVHPTPLGLPSSGLRGRLSSERSAGVAAMVSGLALFFSYFALMAFDGPDSQRTDIMRYVAPMAVAGPFAAFAIAGLVARHVNGRRDRIIAAAVALVGGGSLGIIAVVLFSAAIHPVLNRTNNVLVACAVAVLLGTLVGIVAMWNSVPVARRWLALLTAAIALDLFFVIISRLESFTTAAQSAATSWFGVLLGVAWIGIGASALQVLRRDSTMTDGSGLSGSWGRSAWILVPALAAAGCVIYLGFYGVGGDFVDQIAFVALWLTPVAVAWRRPDVTAARPRLVPALMLVALTATVLQQVTGTPFATLSLFHNGISVLMLVTSAVGYLLIGRELLHLAPATRKRRGLLSGIASLSIVGPVAMASIVLPLYALLGPKWRYHALESFLALTVALALAFALWAPVASALAGTEPHRFWRPLALLLPVTLVASVAGAVLMQMGIAGGENDLYVPVLWISRGTTVAASLLWLFAFGWHVPGARSPDQSVAAAVATA